MMSRRAVIEAVGELLEARHSRENAFCCGASLANTVINDAQQLKIAKSMASEFSRTGADTVVTSCPLCKKTVTRGTSMPVKDLSEIVAEHLA